MKVGRSCDYKGLSAEGGGILCVSDMDSWKNDTSLSDPMGVTFEIGEGITEVGLRAFEGCTNLREVYLPSTLTRVRAYAFRGCTALKTVEAGNREFKYLYEKEEEKKLSAESAEKPIKESGEEAESE